MSPLRRIPLRYIQPLLQLVLIAARLLQLLAVVRDAVLGLVEFIPGVEEGLAAPVGACGLLVSSWHWRRFLGRKLWGVVSVTFAGGGGAVVDMLEARVPVVALVLPVVEVVLDLRDGVVFLVDAFGEVLDFGGHLGYD
jgi:hypothetical protein